METARSVRLVELEVEVGPGDARRSIEPARSRHISITSNRFLSECVSYPSLSQSDPFRGKSLHTPSAQAWPSTPAPSFPRPPKTQFLSVPECPSSPHTQHGRIRGESPLVHMLQIPSSNQHALLPSNPFRTRRQRARRGCGRRRRGGCPRRTYRHENAREKTEGRPRTVSYREVKCRIDNTPNA